MKTLNDILSDTQGNFSIKDVAGAFRVNENTVSKWVYAGKLKAEKVGGVWVIRGKWVSEHIQNNQSGDFKSLAEIMEGYKLPFERDEE